MRSDSATRRHGTVLLLMTVCCATILASEKDQVTFTAVGSVQFQRCPIEKLLRCFHQAFLDIDAKHRDRRTVLGSNSQPSCLEYDLFMLCFSFVDCSLDQIGEIATLQYRKLHSGVQVSKEAFVALRGHLKERCVFDCAPDTEGFCKRRMQPDDQDRDDAILLELNGQRLQMQMGMVTHRHGCHKLQETLRRWAQFRAARCDTKSAFCYCKKQQDKLGRGCDLKCHDLKDPNGAPNLTTNTFLLLPVCSAILLVLFLLRYDSY